jgi:hypothetical protein
VGLFYGFLALGLISGAIALLRFLKVGPTFSPMAILGLALICPGLGIIWNDVEPRLAKRRLEKNGVSVRAHIIHFAYAETGHGLRWNGPAAATFTYHDDRGAELTATCFTWDDELATHWNPGKTALARYDRANPKLAALDGGILTQGNRASIVTGGFLCGVGLIFCAAGFTFLRPQRNGPASEGP